MFHLLILLVCILSIEIFIRFNFLYLLDSIRRVTVKVVHVIPAGNISDHWKERVILAYALRIMKCSAQMLFILLLTLFIFLIVDYFINDFLKFVLSLAGVIDSVIFAFGYIYVRKFFVK